MLYLSVVETGTQVVVYRELPFISSLQRTAVCPMLRSWDRFSLFTLILPRIRSSHGSFFSFFRHRSVFLWKMEASVPREIIYPFSFTDPSGAVQGCSSPWGSQDLGQYHRRTFTGIIEPIHNSSGVQPLNPTYSLPSSRRLPTHLHRQ